MRCFRIAGIFSGLILGLLGVTFREALAACIPGTAYSVTSSAPPPLANWTDTSGATWQPPGGFPGCATGDSAADTNVSPTTLIINSAIPNPIIGLNLTCAGCSIDIQAGGSLTISGAANLGSSTTIVVEPGGSLTIANAGTLTVQSGASLSVNGGYTEVQSGGKIVFNGASTVTNGGTLQLSGGTLTVNNLFTVQSTGHVSLDGGTVAGTSTLSNNGTITENSGTTTLSCIVNNNPGASVNVNGGQLSLSGGGSGNAPFNLAGGAVLDFPSASYSMTPNGIVSGAGTLQVSGGTLSVGGVTSPGGFNMTSGTLTGAGFLTVTSNFNWSSGTITGTGGTQIAGTASGTFDGASGAMVLDGRAFDEYGTATLSSTTNPFNIINGGAFTIYGSFGITDGNITGDATSSLTISPNGFLVKGGSASTSTISLPTYNNSSVGVFSGALDLAGSGTHNGAFFISNGSTLTFSAASTTITSSGFLGADPGTTVVFNGGSASICGNYLDDGLTHVTGSATVSFCAPSYTHDLTFDSGSFTTSSTFDLHNAGLWHGGTLVVSGGGSFYVDASATLTIDGSLGTPMLSSGELVNYGTIDYTSPTNKLTFANSADIDNEGVFDLQTDTAIENQTIIVGSSPRKAAQAQTTTLPKRTLRPTPNLVGGTPYIYNAGTFKKTIGSGTQDIQPSLNNDASVLAQIGTMQFDNGYVQSAGATTLGAGNIKMNGSPLQLNGGTLDGSGTVTGDVTNSAGSIVPGGTNAVGTINVTGNYTQASAGNTNVELASLASYDMFDVSGSVTLDGTLNVALLGGFQPANGNVFDPLTFASRTGDFATKNLPTWAAGHGSFLASYTPTQLQLTAVVTPQSADLALGLSGPSSVNAGAPLSFSITITNNGPDASTGTITVTDNFPTGATSVSGSGTGWSCGVPSGTSITCTSTTTLAASSALPTLTISMNAPPNGGPASNAANVSGTTGDPNNGNNGMSALVNVVAQADLKIVKSGPAGVTAGQNVVYTMTVTNNGPSTATGVVVSDPTPANLTFVSSSCAFPCSIGTMTSGQIVTITSTYSTSPSFAGNVTNTASVSESTADPDNSNNSSSATTNVGAQADLSVTKSGPASANAGSNVSYTVVVTNNGPSPAANVVISDPTPTGVAFLSNAGGCTTPYPCSVGTLNAGGSVSITSTYTIPPSYSSTQVSNTASASSTTNDPTPSNNTSTATTNVNIPPNADVQVSKSGPASTNPNQNIVYTIVAKNLGPQTATGVIVDDPTPSGLTFVSNSGACTTPFPCSIGTLTNGQTATITATFNVPANYSGGTISNTASATATSTDANMANNTSTATTTVSGAAAADVSIFKHAPGGGSPGQNVDFIIDLFNNGPSPATGVVVTDPTPSGLTFVSNSGACTTPFPCNVGTLAPGSLQVIIARYKVTAAIGTTITNTSTVSATTSDPSLGNNASQAQFTVTAPPPCPTGKPVLTVPAENASSATPVPLAWNGVVGAVNYTIDINGPTSLTLSTDQTSASANLTNGNYTWKVSANFAAGCGPTTSATGHFTVCSVPDAPVASVVGESTSGQTYEVAWTPSGSGGSYELQEATEPTFANPTSFIVNGLARSFTKSAIAATPFFYRVRAVACAAAPFSHLISVVVIPLPGPHDPRFVVTVPSGSTTPVVFQIFIPGLPGGPAAFIASSDKPWISVIPQQGIVPTEGTNLTISLDPSALVNGTWTGTVLVVYNLPGSGKLISNVTQTTSIPVSINLVTPVTPGKPPSPTANTLVIPTVGHLFGVDSQWQSDIRVANLTSSKANYLVTFTSNDPSNPVKQTTLSIDAGTTTALDDIVRNWFGVGSLSDSANGLLYIQATDGAGRILSTKIATDVSVSKTTAVSSRTYNTKSTNNAAGTLGQFVPAAAFANFIGKAGGAAAASLQTIQQIAQTDVYRTNLGLVEASGKPASGTLRVFDGAGSKLLDLPFALAGGEQKQLNAFLAQNNITLTNGRLSVEVTGGDGRVQSYASVVDGKSGQPFLVSGAALGAATSNYVVPAVGDLNTGNASWRSDVRIFNAGAASQTATLTYFPNGAPSNSVTKSVVLNPGEVKALDSIVQSLFGLTNSSGTLHVTTATDTQLVVTARTFDQTPDGTLGQFIPAVTNADAVGRNDRALQILQAEESVRYRTNLGIAEVTGKPVTVEVSVFLPDSKVIPRITLTLDANESRQLAILNGLGIGAAYNTRLAVRVVDGEGKVTAYGSVVDMTTQAPTYIPAQ